MPIYRVQAPDGSVLRIEGPEGASEQQLTAAAQSAFQPREPEQPGGSAMSNLAAGAGIAARNMWNGIKQRSEDLSTLTQPVPDNVQRLLAAQSKLSEQVNRANDASVLHTTAGKVGNIGANVAMMLPTAFLPGANTLAGAAAIGGISGALQPSLDAGETVGNAGLGAILSPAALLAGRGMAALYQGGKALLKPFTEAGQREIAGKTLERFAGDPAAAQATLQGARSLVPGSAPTVAEVAQDAGLAQLQRSLVNADPKIADAFARRGADQAAARMQALREVAGDAGQRDFYEAARSATSKDLYGKAFDAGIDPASITPGIKGEVTKLLKRPSIQDAMDTARRLAAEDGRRLTDANQLEGLHYVKKALDDKIATAGQNGIGDIERSALLGTRDKLLNLMDTLSPAYAEARATHAAMSRPINQMDVGQYLLDRMKPALTDYGALPRENANAFAAALRDSAGTARRATGFPAATLEGTLEPAQLEMLRNVAADLARKASAQELGRAVGSNTGQNLVGQNLLESVIGPLGLPKTWASTVAQNALTENLVARPIGYLARPAERRVQDALAQAMLNPQEAAGLLGLALRPRVTGLLASEAERAIAPLTAGLLR